MEALIKTISNEFDIVYVTDSTDSMGSYLKSARDQCINISNKLKAELSQFNFNFGVVFYKDPVYCPWEKNKVCKLIVNICEMKI